MSPEDVADAFRTKIMSETTLFRGDGGVSSTVSLHRMAIKHCLIPFGEDCRIRDILLDSVFFWVFLVYSKNYKHCQDFSVDFPSPNFKCNQERSRHQFRSLPEMPIKTLEYNHPN